MSKSGLSVIISSGKKPLDDVSPVDHSPAHESPPEPDIESGSATKEEVGFHDGTFVCSNCNYYTADDDKCGRWSFKVGPNPDGAWCPAYQPGQDNEKDEGEPDTGGADELEEVQ